MIQSMTGFGNKETTVQGIGKVSVEIRSSNHKFLETLVHLPEGLLSLEDRLKKEIESKIKRGRVTCVVNISVGQASGIFINKALMQNYVAVLKNIKKEFKIKDEVSLNTLINLPGILSLEEVKISKESIWPKLKILVREALGDFISMRQKEGRSLNGYLKSHATSLKIDLDIIKARFKKAIAEKIKTIDSDEERSSFLKTSDITEEIERLTFHIRNFKTKLAKNGAIGKELDFIAQEMQREANTMAAKSFDLFISARTVQIKSQIEKIREQVQNIE